jgi:hypothetical protein
MSLPLLRSTALRIVYHHTQTFDRIKTVTVLDRRWAMWHHVSTTRYNQCHRTPSFSAIASARATRGPKQRPYLCP